MALIMLAVRTSITFRLPWVRLWTIFLLHFAVDHFGSGLFDQQLLCRTTLVDDLADAVVFLARHYSGEGHINVGSGEEVSIRQLAELVCNVVGFAGELEFDTSKPDGTPRKLADVSRLKDMGWDGARALETGLRVMFAEISGD